MVTHGGKVTGLFTIAVPRGVSTAHDAITVTEDGVVGDRKRGARRHVVLLSEEGWDAACEALGVRLDPRLRRGQIVVRGFDLANAVGRRIAVGGTLLEIVDECTPCGRMNEVRPGLKEALRAGVRAGVFGTVIRPGIIRMGDAVHLDETDASAVAAEAPGTTPASASTHQAAASIRVALVLAPVFGNYGSPIALGLAYLAGALRRAGMRVDILDASTRIRDADPSLFADLMVPGFASPGRPTAALDVDLLLEVLYPGCRPSAAALAGRIRAAASVDFQALAALGHLDVVGFHVCDANLYYVAAMAQALRAEGVPVLFGGPSITDTPTRRVLLDLGLCDGALVGEADDRIGAAVRALAGRGDPQIEGFTFRETSRDCARGRLRIFPGGGTPKLRDLPLPDFEGMGVKEHGYIPIHSTRGCINSCTYCSERWYYPRFRLRPVEQVLAEMDEHARRYETTRFQFYDLLINSRERWITQFCEALTARGAPYQWDSFFIPQSLTPGWGERLLAAGCPTVRVGVEHLAPRMLRLMGRDDDVRLLEDNLGALGQSGVTVQMDILVGFPGETEDDHLENLERLERLLGRSPRLTVLLNSYSFNVGSPVWLDPATYGVAPIYYEPGTLPPDAEAAREALAALVMDHRREPSQPVVARRLAELNAVIGGQRVGRQEPAAGPGTAEFAHLRIAAETEGHRRTTDDGTLELAVTSQCNLNCVFCSVPPTEPDRPLRAHDLARRIRESGATEVVLSGGEPTMMRGLPKLVRAAREAGAARVVVETNGTLIGAYPQLADALCAAGIDRFVVSLHGADAAVADAATGAPGSFDLAVAGVAALLKRGAAVTIKTVRYRDNMRAVGDLPGWLHDRFGPGAVSWEQVDVQGLGRAAERPELLIGV